jgi:hypothetical protein
VEHQEVQVHQELVVVQEHQDKEGEQTISLIQTLLK